MKEKRKKYLRDIRLLAALGLRPFKEVKVYENREVHPSEWN